MAFNLAPFTDTTLSSEALELILAEHERDIAPRLRWLWGYFRNEPSRPGGELPQATGLPPRLRGAWDPWSDDRMVDAAASEVVIENDIAWRLYTMIDFMLPEPVVLLSTAGEASQRRRIEAALDAVVLDGDDRHAGRVEARQQLDVHRLGESGVVEIHAVLAVQLVDGVGRLDGHGAVGEDRDIRVALGTDGRGAFEDQIVGRELEIRLQEALRVVAAELVVVLA
ncbi:MAG: hypothetical protein AAFV77_06950, partial [Planctomycetota bacterium]